VASQSFESQSSSAKALSSQILMGRWWHWYCSQIIGAGATSEAAREHRGNIVPIIGEHRENMVPTWQCGSPNKDTSALYQRRKQYPIGIDWFQLLSYKAYVLLEKTKGAHATLGHAVSKLAKPPSRSTLPIFSCKSSVRIRVGTFSLQVVRLLSI
jgi:hypothetical protein